MTIHQQAIILNVDGGERYVPLLHQQEATIAGLQQKLLHSEELQQMRDYTAECMMAHAERRHSEILEEDQVSATNVPEKVEHWWRQQQSEHQLQMSAIQSELAHRERQLVESEHAQAERLAAAEQAVQSLSHIAAQKDEMLAKAAAHCENIQASSEASSRAQAATYATNASESMMAMQQVMGQMQQQSTRLMTEMVGELQREQAEQVRALREEIAAERSQAMATTHSIATPEKDTRDNRFPLANVHTLSAPAESASALPLEYASRFGSTNTIVLTSRFAEEREA